MAVNGVENRPVGCGFCGAQVQGRESEMKTNRGMLKECRWTCFRCGNVVRLEEELIKDENG